jgi:hypothetical protein
MFSSITVLQHRSGLEEVDRVDEQTAEPHVDDAEPQLQVVN